MSSGPNAARPRCQARSSRYRSSLQRLRQGSVHLAALCRLRRALCTAERTSGCRKRTIPSSTATSPSGLGLLQRADVDVEQFAGAREHSEIGRGRGSGEEQRAPRRHGEARDPAGEGALDGRGDRQGPLDEACRPPTRPRRRARSARAGCRRSPRKRRSALASGTAPWSSRASSASHAPRSRPRSASVRQPRRRTSGERLVRANADDDGDRVCRASAAPRKATASADGWSSQWASSTSTQSG